MQENENNVAKVRFENVKPIELERILSLYGMNKQDYCNLRSKTKSWFHNVMRKKRFLNYLDIKVLTDSIGTDTFYTLLERVREQHSPKNKMEQKNGFNS